MDNENWTPRDYRGNPRDYGIRASRRASTWTAAALIAGVAATTGYLAHSIPASGGNMSGGTTRQSPATVSPSTPAVHSPVATSGGSGAGGGGDD